LIVTAIEKAEKSDSVTVVVVVPAILDRRHPPNRLTTALRNEERSLRLAIKGVPTLIQAVPDDCA
jgi:hypothetical protein